MKSVIASALLLAATLTGASPIASPQTTEAPAPAKLFTPPTPLLQHQLPVVLPNGVECISPYLVMAVDESKPDETIPKTKQIGPSVFVAMEFNSTHAGKNCRFHFVFSGLADGGNGVGAEEIFPIKSGVVDEKMTFNTRPELYQYPIASFSVGTGSNFGSPPIEVYAANFKTNFTCPTTKTAWAIRGTTGSLSNWSWNKGLIVEVLGDSPWVDGDFYVNGTSIVL